MAAARALRRRYARAMQQWDVSPGQARALREIAHAHEPVRLSTLADLLHIVPRSATEVVDALESRGLVVRQPDPRDRRATGVVPTSEGSSLVLRLDKARAEAADEYLATLSAPDRKDLNRLLGLLADH